MCNASNYGTHMLHVHGCYSRVGLFHFVQARELKQGQLKGERVSVLVYAHSWCTSLDVGFKHMHLLQNQQKTMHLNNLDVLKYQYKINHTHVYGWVRDCQ